MLNGFKFRLKKVLEVKDVACKQQQKDLSDAAQEKRMAYGQLVEKQHHTENFARELDDIQQLNAGDMHIQYGHYHQLISEVQQQEDHVSNLEVREDQEREKLLKVERERKVLEKLREKDMERFRKDAEKQSQNDIDELAVISARRLACR